MPIEVNKPTNTMPPAVREVEVRGVGDDVKPKPASKKASGTKSQSAAEKKES